MNEEKGTEIWVFQSYQCHKDNVVPPIRSCCTSRVSARDVVSSSYRRHGRNMVMLRFVLRRRATEPQKRFLDGCDRHRILKFEVW